MNRWGIGSWLWWSPSGSERTLTFCCHCHFDLSYRVRLRFSANTLRVNREACESSFNSAGEEKRQRPDCISTDGGKWRCYPPEMCRCVAQIQVLTEERLQRTRSLSEAYIIIKSQLLSHCRNNIANEWCWIEVLTYMHIPTEPQQLGMGLELGIGLSSEMRFGLEQRSGS